MDQAHKNNLVSKCSASTFTLFPIVYYICIYHSMKAIGQLRKFILAKWHHLTSLY